MATELDAVLFKRNWDAWAPGESWVHGDGSVHLSMMINNSVPESQRLLLMAEVSSIYFNLICHPLY